MTASTYILAAVVAVLLFALVLCWMQPRSKANIGNQHTAGHKLTDDHKAKVQAASLKMWQDPQRRAKRSEETKARWADPVWKAAQAEKIRAGKAASRAACGLE